MSTLAQRLRAKLKIDDDHFILNGKGTFEGHGGMLFLSVPNAVGRANAQLAPIHKQLVCCVKALEAYRGKRAVQLTTPDSTLSWMAADEALTALEKLLSEGE